MVALVNPVRTQGRPSRDGNTAGPDSIVTGLRKAVQELQTTNVTRKDIARFAGVTPALVTYYFPDRNALVKTAVLSVIDIFSGRIAGHLAADVDHSHKLFDIIEDTLALYHDNHYVIELVQQTDDVGMMREIKQDIAGFFDAWPGRASRHEQDGWFLATVVFGICHSLSSPLVPYQSQGHDRDAGREAQAAMVHAIMMSSLSGSPIVPLQRRRDRRTS